MIPIGDAESIIFIAPLIIVLIARFYLKEPMPRVFPATFLLTIGGLVLVCQPNCLFHGSNGAEQVSIVGILFLMLMAISWALSSIMVRAAKKAHWLQIYNVVQVEGLLWTGCLMLINDNPFIGLHSKTLSGGHWVSLWNGRELLIGTLC